MSKKSMVLFLWLFLVCDVSQAYMLCRAAGGVTTLRIACKKRETRVNPFNLSVPDQRGVFYLGGYATFLGQTFTESHSFPFQMDAALSEDKIVILSSGSSSSQCPGSVDEPTATAGYLCVYLSPQSTRGWVMSVLAPNTLQPGTALNGFILRITANANGLNSDILATGSWAIGRAQ
ncbi:MAG: hypothetical protein ACKN9W_16980 [Methylococcus sp.]